MTHPVEQLVDYVDGTLPGREREVVRAHLQTCARCREEVTLAGAAKQALAELPEVQAPVGLWAAAVARAEADAAERAPEVASLAPRQDRMAKTEAPAWYRWGGAAAAVAAALLVVVVVLPKVGGNDDDATPAAAPGMASSAESGGASFTAAREVKTEQKDFDTREVQRLALAFDSFAGPPPSADRAATEDGVSDPVLSGHGVPGAVACLEQAFPHLAGSGPPVELIRARFQRTPAYLGVYATGPGAGQPADTITVWVASADDCTILHTTQVRI